MPCIYSGGCTTLCRRIFQSIFCSLILLAKPADGTAVQDPVFSVSAECRDNEKCVFEHSYIDVDIVLKNISDAEVGVPLEFLRQLGPYGVLIDNETKDEVPLHVGLPDLSLMHTFTPIPPGATVKVTQFLSASTIAWPRPAMVDLTARFAIRIPIKLKGRVNPVPFSGSASVRIIGRDKLDNIRDVSRQ
jgi:hypothetical protein